MPCFEPLPKVKSCCCFSLEKGSIFFAILGVISICYLFDLLIPCKGEKTYMKFFKFIWAISTMTLFGASVIFLIGLCCHRKRITATVFLSASAISIFVSIGMVIMGTTEYINKTNCFGVFHLIIWYLDIPVGVYSMIVVRSYRSSMRDASLN